MPVSAAQRTDQLTSCLERVWACRAACDHLIGRGTSRGPVLVGRSVGGVARNTVQAVTTYVPWTIAEGTSLLHNEGAAPLRHPRRAHRHHQPRHWPRQHDPRLLLREPCIARFAAPAGLLASWLPCSDFLYLFKAAPPAPAAPGACGLRPIPRAAYSRVLALGSAAGSLNEVHCCQGQSNSESRLRLARAYCSPRSRDAGRVRPRDRVSSRLGLRDHLWTKWRRQDKASRGRPRSQPVEPIQADQDSLSGSNSGVFRRDGDNCRSRRKLS